MTRYAPLNWCLYCGAKISDGAILTDEHVIPISFGGEIVLPKASCLKCQKEINKVETHCLNGMIETARHHLGIRGRQKTWRRDRALIRFDDGTSKSVPIADHPSAIVMPILPLPGVISGIPNQIGITEPEMRIVISPTADNIMERIIKTGRSDVSLTRGLSAINFSRMIAKIAHAYAVAELGTTFYSVLRPVILGKLPLLAADYIGSGPAIENKITQRHELKFLDSWFANNLEYIVVSVRLFANRTGMPTHVAVVGVRHHPHQEPETANLSDTKSD